MRVVDIINQLQLKDIDIQYRFIFGDEHDGLLGYTHYADNDLHPFDGQAYEFSLLTPVVQYSLAKCPQAWGNSNPNYLIVWVRLEDMSQ